MGQICSFLWTHKNKKAFSLREGKPLPPYPPPGTLPPEAPLGAPLPDPRYRLALRARHGIRILCSSKLILKKALVSSSLCLHAALISLILSSQRVPASPTRLTSVIPCRVQSSHHFTRDAYTTVHNTTVCGGFYHAANGIDADNYVNVSIPVESVHVCAGVAIAAIVTIYTTVTDGNCTPVNSGRVLGP